MPATASERTYFRTIIPFLHEDLAHKEAEESYIFLKIDSIYSLVYSWTWRPISHLSLCIFSFFWSIFKDAVTVVGYPLGGETISVSKGVISRIEVCSKISV